MITTLCCPHCHKPMIWLGGNPIFSYWICKHCSIEFEYHIWTETFHDEINKDPLMTFKGLY